MAVYQWSPTPAANATADPTINWAPGMSPSSVSNSARSMMARVANYRDDISGSLTTTGSSTAYNLTSNQGLPATPVTGQLIAFVPHVANGSTPSLRIDGGGVFALFGSSGSFVAPGTLVAGSPYTAMFNGSVWIMRNFYGQPFSVPLGALIPYVGVNVPNINFAQPFGQAISRTVYSDLFSLVSTTYGSGDGTTTFNIPDLRGRFPVGNDNMGGTAANRVTPAGSGIDGATLGAAGGAQNVTLSLGHLPQHRHNVGLTDPQHNHTYSQYPSGTTFNVAPSGGAPVVGTASTTAATSTSATGITIHDGVGNANLTSIVGSDQAHTNMPPTIVLAYIMRIL